MILYFRENNKYIKKSIIINFLVKDNNLLSTKHFTMNLVANALKKVFHILKIM